MAQPEEEPQSEAPRKHIWPLVIAGLIIFIVGGVVAIVELTPKGEPEAAAKADICSQSMNAAHYIAAESGNNPGGVVAVTDDVIAHNKYPELGDKLVANIGAIVALKLSDGETPDEIVADLRASCPQ